MSSVKDIAAYILHKKGSMPPMKLQKLAYYSQAWSLVWDDSALFPERIEAWANGPVVPALYELHKGQFPVTEIAGGNFSSIPPVSLETIDKILDYYGDKSSQWLSDLTHMEDPWMKARQRAGLMDGQRGNEEIKWSDMEEYYGSLS